MIFHSHILRSVKWVVLLVVLLFVSCDKKDDNPYRNLSLDYYAPMREKAFVVDADKIRNAISNLIYTDSDTILSSSRLRRYYSEGGDFVWITRLGVDERADSLFTYLQQVKQDGFSIEKFHIDEMAADIAKLRSLDADSIGNINKLMARLEYRLSKAYLHYVSTMRYGYVNPYQTFNRLDPMEADNPRAGYHTLYDVPTEVAKADFLPTIFRKATADSIGAFLRSIQPTNPYYYMLRSQLATPGLSRGQRMKIMVNMERCRWRVADLPHNHQNYVMVNIPAYMLRAVCADTIVEMKIVCGAMKTKTPIITSKIKRIDVNPQWIIPRSIIKTSVAHHAGNVGYFASHRYFIRHRATGKKVSPSEVSADMLLGGEYAVVQEGGAGNSLGRIIFRFDNNLSIYLHDTSSPSVFERSDRRASHGCVRVERPYLLATSILGKGKEKLLARLNYSINADVSPLGKKRSELSEAQQAVADTLQRSKLIGSLNVDPRIPVFITYFTLYPSINGSLVDYPDVYGYDEIIARKLKKYM